MTMKALVYGGGDALMRFMDQFPFKEYIEILGIVDPDSSHWGASLYGVGIYPPEVIAEGGWDKVVATEDATYGAVRGYLDRIAAGEQAEELEPWRTVSYKDLVVASWLIVPDLCNMGDMELDVPGDRLWSMSDLLPDHLITHNRIEDYIFNQRHRPVSKWWQYPEIYERHFSRFVGKPVRVLEIGIFQGGSLQMWKNYFGEQAIITGIDIVPRCKEYEEDRINICIGSQNDAEFLAQVIAEHGPFDIVVDDGSHEVTDQRDSFEALFPSLNNNGVYLVEDTHTSYMPNFGGAPYLPGSFIEYAKNFIDCLHLQHMPSAYTSLLAPYAGDIGSCHYYDSVVVVEKRRRGRSITSLQG